jgi:hypothetical protein
MQTGIFGLRGDSFARRVGLLSAILLLCSAPPAKLLGQDVGSSSGSVFHIHGVVLRLCRLAWCTAAKQQSSLESNNNQCIHPVRKLSGRARRSPAASGGTDVHVPLAVANTKEDFELHWEPV